jgi:hypothetical protein
MPPAGLEPTISVLERANTVHDSHHAATVIGAVIIYAHYNINYTLTTATFADDTAVLATHSDPAITSQKLQTTYLQSKTGLRNGE